MTFSRIRNAACAALASTLSFSACAQQADFAHRLKGRTFDVLFDKAGRKPGQIVGRSPWLQPVVVAAPEALIGSLATVRVTETGSNSLFADLTSDVPSLQGHDGGSTYRAESFA